MSARSGHAAGAAAPVGPRALVARPGLSLGRSALAAAILAGVALPAELCTLLYGALLLPLVWRNGFAGWRALALPVAPFVALLVLGALVEPGKVETWAFAQDAWRAGKPVLLLALGFAAVRSSARARPFPGSVAAIGLAYALVYLARLGAECVARGVGPLALSDVLVVGHFPEALTLGVCLRERSLSAGRAGWFLRRAAFAACALALALSGSRTWILFGGAMLLAGAGWLRSRGRWRGALLALALVVAALATPLGATLFTKGFDVALAEVSPARYTELGDIHENWRGYESWQALRAFAEGTPLQQALGQGFGAKADLGLYIELGGVDFREIGQFHNGWLWVALKTGWLGVALVVLWFARMLALARTLAARGNRAAADLCLGVVLGLCMTTVVVSGPFNALSNDSALLVLGGFLALASGRTRRGRAPGAAP